MRLILWIIVIASLTVSGCGRSKSSYNKAITNTIKFEPNVAAFERLYPGADHKISYYSGELGTPRWHSKAMLHGRYILSMTFQVSITSSGTQVQGITEPKFYLREVSDVTPEPGGGARMTYDGIYREFGLKEWDALVASDGDLSSIGVDAKPDKPVANLATHWRSG